MLRPLLPRHALAATATLTALAALLVAAPQAMATPGVKWARGKGALAKALEQARKKNTLVILDVYADWCGPCHRYDNEVFNRKDVAKALGDAVTVRIDGEKEDGPEVVRQYHVVGYPTILFLNPDGTERDRIFGFMDAAQFTKTAADYLAGQNTTATMQATLEQRPDDHDLRFTIGERLVVRGDLPTALKLLKPIFDDDPANKLGFRPRIHLMLARYAYLRGNTDYPRAIEHLRALLDKHPTSDEAAQAQQPLATALLKSGKPDEATKALETWLKAAPDDVKRRNAIAWFCFQNDLALDRATTIAEEGLKLDPKASYLWDTLAEIHFKQGKKAEAVEAIKQAIAADPKDPYYKKQLKRFQKKTP